MADEVAYSLSTSQQETLFDFSSRQYTYIPDQNSGSYPNGSIVFDLASLANSGKFWDPRQSFLTIPLVMNLNVSGGTMGADAENVFSMSLKNGFHHLINSLSVEITNNQVVNLTNLSNLDIHYRLISSMNSEDVVNLGPSLGFAKDNAESISYVASGLKGIGEINNNITEASSNTAGGWKGPNARQGFNAGRLQRMNNTSFDPASSVFSNASNSAQAGKNYCVQSDTNVTYYIIATLPLRFLHSIFNQLPLAKGIYCRLIVNTNCQSSSVLTIGTTGTLYTNVVTSSQSNTLPFMVSQIGTTRGLVTTAATTGLTASIGIGKSVIPSTFTHPTLQTCRIYACMYEMSPAWEEQYFSIVPTKKILYNDILSFQVLNVGAGASFSQILTNGVSRARYLLMVPQLSASVNGSANATDQVRTGINVGSPMNSPFSSSPATCLPHAYVTNFNVLLSGTNLYQSNISYRFEQWQQENRASNSINGGLTLGMSSGILSQSDFENGYGYIYVDLSRKISQSSDDISRSIQVVGTNSSLCMVDYHCVISYEREIVLSTSTGSLVI